MKSKANGEAGADGKPISVMPYSMMVGQRQLKLALELTYVAPRIGGVLLSGHRGTGKSTVVRAFSLMAYGKLPVTIPINATEDRVVGGWDLNELFKAKLEPREGLIQEANGGLLYIDEVNLLDDHIVNIILDVTSTGILVIEREGRASKSEVRFTLVGTMNPSEGGLRPQLLDRFGLMVDVVTEASDARSRILQTVLEYDAALALERGGGTGKPLESLQAARAEDERHRVRLEKAKAFFPSVEVGRDVAEACVRIGSNIKSEGHRGDYVMALAAQARAALNGAKRATVEDLLEVAPLALQHRKSGVLQSGSDLWSPEDNQTVLSLIAGDPSA